MEVAKTILEQLGGRQFILMTGAKDFVWSEDTLMFRLPGPTMNGINKVVVRLTPMDVYHVTFGKVRGADWEVVAEHEGVYCDMLVELFERETGLYTTLFPRKAV